MAGNRTGAGAASFTYDPQNRLTAGGGKTYSWSDRGTMLSSVITATSAVTTMVFDAFNQNLSSTSVAVGTTTMVYDGLGRISTRNSVQFKYNGTGIDPISDGTWTSVQNPSGQVHATKNNTAGTARWALANTHDDLGAWINPAGTGVDTTVGYDPYGQVTGRTGALTPTGGFQGDWTDPTTNEVWMGARHYTPGTATFTSRDTYAGQLATPISLNRYTYAHGNPLNMIDPDGHAAVATQSHESYMAEVLGKIATDRDNNELWYRTIAQNNGATDDAWNLWWATYLSTVLEPSYMALIEAADAYWHSQNKPVAIASGGSGGGVQTVKDPPLPGFRPGEAVCWSDGQKGCDLRPAGDFEPDGQKLVYIAALGGCSTMLAGTRYYVTPSNCSKTANVVSQADAWSQRALSALQTRYPGALGRDGWKVRAVKNALNHGILGGFFSVTFQDADSNDMFGFGWGLELLEVGQSAFKENCYSGGVDAGFAGDGLRDLMNNMIGFELGKAIRGGSRADRMKRVADKVVGVLPTMYRLADEFGCRGPISQMGNDAFV